MLRVGAAIAVPSVVRKVDQHLRSVLGKTTYFIRENGFVTNENSKLSAVGGKWVPRCAGGEIAHFFRQASCKREQVLKGHVLPERYEVDFVIAPHPVATRADKFRRVVHPCRLLELRGMIHSDRPSQNPRIGASCDIADGVSEYGISAVERGGRFRPDDQVRVSRRTEAGVRQFTERGHEVVTGPIRAFQNRNIRLHEGSGFVGSERRNRHYTAHLQNHGSCNCRQQQRVALVAANQKNRGPRGADNHNFERKAVHPSDSRNPRQRDVVDLSDAQQVPGKSANTSSGQLNCNPSRGRDQQSSATKRTAICQPADQQSKEAVIKPEIQTKQNKNAERGRSIEAAV